MQQALHNLGQIIAGNHFSLVNPFALCIFSEAQQVSPIPTNRANHITFHPPPPVPPRSRKFEWDFECAVIRHSWISWRCAQRNYSTKALPLLDWLLNNYRKPRFHHFWWDKPPVETHAHNCSLLRVILQSHCTRFLCGPCFFGANSLVPIRSIGSLIPHRRPVRPACIAGWHLPQSIVRIASSGINYKVVRDPVS